MAMSKTQPSPGFFVFWVGFFCVYVCMDHELRMVVTFKKMF